MRGGWSGLCPGRLTRGKETRGPIYRRMSGLRKQSEQLWSCGEGRICRTPDRPVLASRHNEDAIQAPAIV